MTYTTCLWTTIPNGLCRGGVDQSILVGKRFKKDTDMLRMQAYYYGFSTTTIEAIDLVLCAVAAAGKLFHHTDQWTSEIDYQVENVRGKSPVDWIQNAADDAAETYKRLIAERERELLCGEVRRCWELADAGNPDKHEDSDNPFDFCADAILEIIDDRSPEVRALVEGNET